MGIEITRLFSSEPLVSHPRNHCIPLHEVLDVQDDVQDEAILVLPTLRPSSNQPLETVGESVEFFRRVFEGNHSLTFPPGVTANFVAF